MKFYQRHIRVYGISVPVWAAPMVRAGIRGSLVTASAVGWFLAGGYLFLDFLPANFGYYNTLVRNQGTNNFDVYFFWTWIPTLLILVSGMFWSAGIFDWLWDILT